MGKANCSEPPNRALQQTSFSVAAARLPLALAAERRYVGRTTRAHEMFVRTALARRTLKRVLTEFRGRIARWLAFCVLLLTFGRVQVNSTGRSTIDGPGRDDTHVSARPTP
jgi:hypothetical protein